MEGEFVRELKPYEKLIVGFILESDAIENIFDYPDDVTRQVAQGYEKGHVGALLSLKTPVNESRDSYMDKNLVCNIQKLIVEEQPEKGQRRLSSDQVGCYRTCGVRVGDRKCVPPEDVPNLMEALFKKVVWIQSNSISRSNEQNLNHIANFHYEFLRIHPFADGNGRTARALTYYLMKFCFIRPFIFTSRDKHEKYYPCFNSENSYLMQEYFKEKYEEARKGVRV